MRLAPWVRDLWDTIRGHEPIADPIDLYDDPRVAEAERLVRETQATVRWLQSRANFRTRSYDPPGPPA